MCCILDNYYRILAHPRCGRDEEEEMTRRFIRLFRLLDLLIQDCSRVLSVLYGSCHLLAICVSITCTYGAIRFNGALAISLGWIGSSITVFLAIIVGLFGRFNHSSILALRRIRKRQAGLHLAGKEIHSRWLRREIRCLRDLRLGVGSAFFYDKILLLTTFQIILQNTANLLLLQ